MLEFNKHVYLYFRDTDSHIISWNDKFDKDDEFTSRVSTI